MIRTLLFGLLGLLGLVTTSAVQAQQLTQQSGTHLDAATTVAAATAAVNTALTLTLSAVAGQYHYITNISVGLCNNSTGTASPIVAVSSTNLGGWLSQIGIGTGIGNCQYKDFVYGPGGLKSNAAGVATTIVVAAPATLTGAVGTVSYYTAP